MAMASVLAEMPDLRDRMLNEHLPDASGRCAACRDELGTQASWPCLTYTVAEQARSLSEGGSAQSAPPAQPRQEQSRPIAPVPQQGGLGGKHAR